MGISLQLAVDFPSDGSYITLPWDAVLFHTINEDSLVLWNILFSLVIADLILYGSIVDARCTSDSECRSMWQIIVIGSRIMSLSTRVSIGWPPDIPPQENTNTLVLTFPSNHFVDLRPLTSGHGLDWGMGGYQMSSSTPEGTKSTTPFPHLFQSFPYFHSLGFCARFGVCWGSQIYSCGWFTGSIGSIICSRRGNIQ